MIREAKSAAYTAAGKIPLDYAIRSKLGVPIEALRPSDGIFTAGVAGMSGTECVSCPAPRFSDEALRDRVVGSVLLIALISAEGVASDIGVKRSVGYGLDEKAIEAVKGWRFAPARDLDGRAVPVRQFIEVTFQFTRRP
jgi:TonB family protein